MDKTAHCLRQQDVISTRLTARSTSEGGMMNKDRPSAMTSSRMYSLFGFKMSDFSSWTRFVELMNRPMDPSALGIARFLFGLLMIFDIFDEREFVRVNSRWGDSDECRFPLFNALQPLPVQWMYIVYALMLTGACGIMLGLFYRAACLMFAVCYWYIFFLDKTRWNNHSYLYGLCSLMFLSFEGNRYLSLDGLRRPKIRNADVPLWNYCLIRAQFFLVYFIAGLKKVDADWIGGHSVQLASHWAFKPFSVCMSEDQVDLWIVHRGGLFIDLFVGYFLFFDLTRPVGFLIAFTFNSMNSQIFSIGMFPYTMLCNTPIFCRADWPKRLLHHLPSHLRMLRPSTALPQYSTHCIYPKRVVKPDEIVPSEVERKRLSSQVVASSCHTTYHKSAATFSIIYLLLQCFLPYSHFLTSGYNNWTDGLYGYSWNMMVHSWSVQHIRITYVDKDTDDVGYMNPRTFTKVDDRWSYRADTVKQFAMCIKERLAQDNMTSVALYFDVWRSLNNRFQQRMFNSSVDLVTAEWSPFQHTSWVMPLLVNLSDWRARQKEMERTIYNSSSDIDVVFVADFPGLSLENYVQGEFSNASVEVLAGVVTVELEGRTTNYTLGAGERLMLPPGEYHKVHTVSVEPSCYMYQYVNTTQTQLDTKISRYEAELNDNPDIIETLALEDPQFVNIYEGVQTRKRELERRATRSLWQRMLESLHFKYRNVIRSLYMTGLATQSIVTGQSFETLTNSVAMVD